MTWHGSRGSARCAPTMSPSGGSAGAALPSSILDTTTSCLLHTTAPSSFNPSMIIIVARKHCWECDREHVKLWICICLRLVVDQCKYYYSKYCIIWLVIINSYLLKFKRWCCLLASHLLQLANVERKGQNSPAFCVVHNSFCPAVFFSFLFSSELRAADDTMLTSLPFLLSCKFEHLEYTTV